MNSYSDASDVAAKHVELRAYRDSFAVKLTAALTAAGFTVSGTMSAEDWRSSLLTVKSDKEKTFEIYASFEIESTSRYSRNSPGKVRLVYGLNSGFRGTKTRYHKLDDALVTKLVSMAVEHLESVIRGIESRKAYETDQQRWARVRVEQLQGVVIPPGTEIKIVTGDGPGAGAYHVEFNRSHSISNTPLTPEQVRRLVDLLNEFQGTKDAYVLVAKHNMNGEPIWFSDGYYWVRQDQDHISPMIYPSKEAAEAGIEKATSREQVQDVEVVTYASVASI